MRIVVTRPAHLARALFSLCLVVAAGCGGTTTGTNPVPGFGNGLCDPGTSVQLAFPNDTSGNPTPTGVSTNIGHVEIVAAGNSNTLGNSFTSWDTVLIPTNGSAQIGSAITGGFLTQASDPNGPHPFQAGNPGDFYYNSSVPQLQPGVLYVVQLNVPSSNCQPVTIGQFGT